MSSVDYPITINTHDGALIDQAGNVESALSILYGDLSDHDGKARTIFAPPELVEALAYHASINADCFGIPIDVVFPSNQ